MAATMKAPARLACSGCGASVDAACACGVAYLPAGQLVAAFDAEQPGLSSRAVAKATGLSYEAVNQARKSGVNHLTPLAETAIPLKVVGLDGKLYPARRPACGLLNEHPPYEGTPEYRAAVEALQKVTKRGERQLIRNLLREWWS